MRYFLLASITIWFMVKVVQADNLHYIYTAKADERPEDIAKRFGISVSDLLRVNPALVADQLLKPGEVILVPSKLLPNSSKTNQFFSTSKQSSNFSITSIAKAFWVVTVGHGETLSSIAQKFHLPVEILAKANNISVTTTVVFGQVLMVPVLEQPISSADTETKKTKGSNEVKLSSNKPSLNKPSLRKVSSSRPPALPAPRMFGYVGVVGSPIASIRSRPSPKASVWSRCPYGIQLIIVDERKNWWGVLMVNGAIGWVSKSDVKKGNQVFGWDDLWKAFGQASVRRDSSYIVSEAMHYLGVPYRYGYNSPIKGLDCSAFVQRVFASRGIFLPRTSSEQANVGIPVNPNDLRPGDRLYFAVKGNRIDHCGIYIGNGLFIHASGRHDAVVISSLSEPLYSRSLVAIRR